MTQRFYVLRTPEYGNAYYFLSQGPYSYRDVYSSELFQTCDIEVFIEMLISRGLYHISKVMIEEYL